MAIIPLERILGDQVVTQVITESGLWIHPEPGIAYHLYLEIYGGGGGGGSGSVIQASTTMTSVMFGGSAGELGGRHIGQIIVAEDQSVVIGAGGSGANAPFVTASTNTIGSAGGNGGYSSFGSLRADGGDGGIAGKTAGYTGEVSAKNAGFSTFDYFQLKSMAASNRKPVATGARGLTQTFSGVTSEGGGTGSSYFRTVSALGGAGKALGNVPEDTLGNSGEAPPLDDYGAGGGGGGSIAVVSQATLRRITAGAGGKGAQGFVRLWAWRANK